MYHKTLFFLIALTAIIAPFLMYPAFLMHALCLALFASAFNVLLGFGGLLSFGHAAFFGWGAYTAAYVAKTWGFGPEISLLTGVCTALFLGVIFGVIAIRRQGIYFAMVTLALAQMMYFVAVQAPFTNSEDGIQGVPRGYFLGLVDLANQYTMYYFVLFVVSVSFLCLYRIIHSPFGQVLKAIRENETRAQSMGYEAQYFKLAAFVFSAAFSGLAGALNTLSSQVASLTNVSWHLSGEVVLMTLLGGIGTMRGPIIGTFILVSIQSFFASWGAWVTIIQGGFFIFCTLFFRQGVVGFLDTCVHKFCLRKRQNDV